MLPSARKISFVLFVAVALVVLAAFRYVPPSPEHAETEKQNDSDNTGSSAKVAWSRAELKFFLSPQDSLALNLSISSTATLEDITLSVAPELASYVHIQPLGTSTITAAKPLRIRLIVEIPSQMAIGNDIDGAVRVNQGTRTVSKPLQLSIRIVSKALKMTLTSGIEGGAISLPGGGSFSLSPGMLSRETVFDITPLQRGALPSSVPPFATIYAAMDLEATPVVPDPTTPAATNSYQAHLEVPLPISLEPGTKLMLLKENRFKDNWIDTGDRATVSASGRTASVFTKSIGKLLLVDEGDLGQENEP